MAKQATLKQWKELYDLTLEITKLKPWKSYWDLDLIAVETKKNEEPNFVSIMGKSGTCTGISVYHGMEGYSDFVKSVMMIIMFLQHLSCQIKTALLATGETEMK